MEFLEGGELFQNIRRKRKYSEKESALTMY